MGFTVSPEFALSLSAGATAAYSASIFVPATRKPLFDFYFTPGKTGQKGVVSDWFALGLAGNALGDVVALKDKPTKKQVQKAGCLWLGCASLLTLQHFGPKKAVSKKGFYLGVSTDLAVSGLCFLAAKDMM